MNRALFIVLTAHFKFSFQQADLFDPLERATAGAKEWTQKCRAQGVSSPSSLSAAESGATSAPRPNLAILQSEAMRDALKVVFACYSFSLSVAVHIYFLCRGMRSCHRQAVEAIESSPAPHATTQPSLPPLSLNLAASLEDRLAFLCCSSNENLAPQEFYDNSLSARNTSANSTVRWETGVHNFFIFKFDVNFTFIFKL